MEFTFRKLSSDDIFLMFTIIGKLGFNAIVNAFDNETVREIKKQCAKAKENGDMTKDEECTIVGQTVAGEVGNVIIGKLPICKNEIYQMLVNTSDKSIEEIKENPILMIEMLVAFFKKEEFGDFLKVVSKLFS